MRFGEIKILLSDDLTDQSRIMLYRAVAQRVRQIAPFFRFDRDPYMVVADDGTAHLDARRLHDDRPLSLLGPGAPASATTCGTP